MLTKEKAKKKEIPIKSPELIQAILDEANDVIKSEHVIITETKHGLICANSGIDKSNIEGEDNIALLPLNPDEQRLEEAFSRGEHVQ